MTDTPRTDQTFVRPDSPRREPPPPPPPPAPPPPRRAPPPLPPPSGQAASAPAYRPRPAGSSSSGSHAAGTPGLIGRYVVEGELGRGGMGVVLRARDPSLGRAVAIKVIRNPLVAGPEVVRRFALEARAVAKLRHPGIVAVHEVGEEGGRPYIVMDLIEGRSLERILDAGRIPPRELAELVATVAVALDHAHGHGIVHRDVKPANVMIDGHGRAVLMDFGLAREVEGDGLTATGQVLGTPSYMAPEQAGDGESIGPATDVWALGGLLYRGLTGRPPFAGDHAIAIIKKVLLQDPEPLRSIDPSVHPDLERVALRCLEKRPDQRYPSAAEVAADLRRFVAGEAIRIRPLARRERLARWAGRHRGLVAVSVVLACALAAAGATATVAMMRGHRARASDAAVELVDAARTFREGRDGLSADLPPDAVDDVLGAGLDAVAAAERAVRIGGGEPEEIHGLAVEVGDLAVRAARWSIARGAFRRALRAGFDPAAARARLATLDAARDQAASDRADAAAAILARAEAGQLESALALEDAVFELVGLRSEATARLLVGVLGEHAAELERVARAELLAVAEPTAEERSRGEGEIDGLAEEIDAALAHEGIRAALRREEKRPGTSPSLLQAGRRLTSREAASRRGSAAEATTLPRDRPALVIVADAQARALGAGRLRRAELCAVALGRLELSRIAAPALLRHLAAEFDPDRAIAPGRALCHLGVREAEPILAATRSHFGQRSSFWRGVRLAFTRLGGGGAGDDAGDPDLGAAEGAGEGVEALSRRGVAALERRDGELAAKVFGEVVALRPEDAESWHCLGYAHFLRDDLEGARDAIDRALAIDDERSSSWNMSGNILRRRGRLRDAIAHFDRAVEHAEDGNLNPLRSRALAHLDLGDHARARADVELLLEKGPESATAWLTAGNVRMVLGEAAGAVEAYTRATELEPDSAVAFWRGAQAELVRRRPDAAFVFIERAFRIAPDDPDVNRERARVLAALGRPEQARESAERSIGAREDHDGWMSLAEIHAARGDRDAMEAAAKRAIELASDARGYRHRAGIRARMGDFAGALDDLDLWIAEQPDDVAQLSMRGALRANLGRFAEALADFDRVIELAPNDPRHRLRRGETLMNMGRLDEARRALEEALALAPEGSPIVGQIEQRLAQISARR